MCGTGGSILLFSETTEELAGVTGRDANEIVTDVNKEVLIGGDTQNNRLCPGRLR